MPPTFELGQCVATLGALRLLWETQYSVLCILRKHLLLDQGTLCDEDHAANLRAAEMGDRILSSFAVGEFKKVWVITEHDRSVTTILLPEEY